MSIVGGLDIHRKQLTFDYLDTATGEARCGQVRPADGEFTSQLCEQCIVCACCCDCPVPTQKADPDGLPDALCAADEYRADLAGGADVGATTRIDIEIEGGDVRYWTRDHNDPNVARAWGQLAQLALRQKARGLLGSD